jgi:DNA ligase (NAD+)
MASEKAARILRKREAPFTQDQITTMPESQAWAWIYANDREFSTKKSQARIPEVCFTGFTDSERDMLSDAARQVGLHVKDSVTKNLLILVIGENAGPSKIAKAEKQRCIITDRDGFADYVRSKNQN